MKRQWDGIIVFKWCCKGKCACMCVWVCVCAACDRVNMHSILGSVPEIGEIHLPHNKQLKPQKQISLKEIFVSLQQMTFHGRRSHNFPSYYGCVTRTLWVIWEWNVLTHKNRSETNIVYLCNNNERRVLCCNCRKSSMLRFIYIQNHVKCFQTLCLMFSL